MWKTTASSLRPLVSVLAVSLAWCTAPSVAGDKDGGKHYGRPIPCAELPNLKVSQTTIASAEIVPAPGGLPETPRARIARHVSSGSIDDAANFECRTPDHHHSKDR